MPTTYRPKLKKAVEATELLRERMRENDAYRGYAYPHKLKDLFEPLLEALEATHDCLETYFNERG